MQFLRNSLTALFLMFTALALLLYAGQTVFGAIQERMAQETKQRPARERVFAVNVTTATPETIVPVLEAFGEVQSRRTLELRAAVGGRVVWLNPAFVEGGRVVAGQELLRIDDAATRRALERAETDERDAEAEERDAARGLQLSRDELASAEEQADLRERALRRQKDLEDRGVVTAAAVETADLAAASARQAVVTRRVAVANAEARVDQSATRLARARLARADAARDLEETVVKASFTGTLSDVTLVEGRLVSPNEQVARLVDDGSLEAAFRVSTAQYVRLLDASGRLMNAPVRVRLGVGGADLLARGRLERDGAAVGEGLSGRLLFARLDSAPGFKPGDFVTVAVEEPAMENLVRLPAAAYGSDGAVLLVGGEERIEVLPVRLERRQGNDVLLQAEGLEGREVILARTPLLGPGVKVRPVRPRTDGAALADAAQDMIELTAERRARLVAFVEANDRMPAEAKARALTALSNAKVPQRLITRLESRMGG